VRQEGQVVPRGNGKWLVRAFKGRSPEGKRTYVSKMVRGSKREAGRVLRDLLGRKDSGTLVPTTRESVAVYLARWLDRTARGQVRARSLDLYRWVVERYITPALGMVPLARLQPDQVRSLYHSLTERKLSPATIRLVHAVLCQAVEQAVTDGLLPRNPVALATPPKLTKREPSVIAPDQIGAFLDAARTDAWFPLWLTLLTTGLRPGEALALQWSDFDGTTLRITKSLAPDGTMTAPKTEAAKRSVMLPETTARVLKSHRGRLHGFIFAGPDGQPPDYRTLVRRHFKPLLQRAGLPSTLRVYDLRHSSATLLMSEGVHPKVVAERLGHSKVNITLDTYSHVLPSMQRQAADSLNQLVAGR